MAKAKSETTKKTVTKNSEETSSPNGTNKNEDKTTCGIVMPISPLDGYSIQHWSDVRGILEETIESAGFSAEMVNTNEKIGVIHKRIIQNLYNNEILVCDVSGKNLNVMLELGMRLAFDKPTIVVKDNETEYSFDIAPLEHISYPKDLRYNQIELFKNQLRNKLKTVYKNSKEEGYSTFLQNFGNYEIKGLQNQEISSQDYIIKEIKALRKEFNRLNNQDLHLQKIKNNLELDIVSNIRKDNLRQLIAHSKIKELFRELNNLSIENESQLSQIESLHKRWDRLGIERALGEISDADYRVAYNRLIKGVLQIIDSI